MTLRDTRRAPFCWQSKVALRYLRAHYDGERLKQRSTALAIYVTLTEIASDQHNQNKAEVYVSLLVERTGTSEATVKRYLRDFEEIGLIEVARRKADDRVNLANIYYLRDAPELDRGDGLTGEPRVADEPRASGKLSTIVDKSPGGGFTGETKGLTWTPEPVEPGAIGEPNGTAGEPLIEERYEQGYEEDPSKKGDPRVRQVLVPLFRELGDRAPEWVIERFGNRLYARVAASGATFEEFVALCDYAKQRTRQAQGAQPPGVRIENKPGYMMRVLENLVRDAERGLVAVG